MPGPTTSRGLPIISEDQLNAFMSRYGNESAVSRKEYGDFLMAVKSRLITENPNLTKFIEFVVGKDFHPNLHPDVFGVLIGVYALLEAQAEANQIDSQLKT